MLGIDLQGVAVVGVLLWAASLLLRQWWTWRRMDADDARRARDRAEQHLIRRTK